MISQYVNGQAAKSLVVILTSISAALALYYGTAKWEPVAILAIGIVVHYLVPNAPAPAPAAQPAQPPASPPVAGL